MESTELKPQPAFFPGSKRKLVLEDWAPKMNNESEKRIRLDFAMQLTGENVVGMPSCIGQPFESMSKEDSADSKTILSTELEGITIEFWATETSKQRALLLTACTLRSFYLTRDEDSTVSLRFNTTVPRDQVVVLWAHDNQGSTMWAGFTATQPSLKAPAPEKQMKLGEKSEPVAPLDEDRKKAVEEAPLSRAAKEKEAKETGKPRGFTRPVHRPAVDRKAKPAARGR